MPLVSACQQIEALPQDEARAPARRRRLRAVFVTSFGKPKLTGRTLACTAESRHQNKDLQVFSLMLCQLSYRGMGRRRARQDNERTTEGGARTDAFS